MKRKSDAQLMDLVNRKRHAALEELYDRYIKLVYSFAFKLSNQNEEKTKEMTQLVFLKLWTTNSTYDPTKGSFINWLLTLTRNVCIDYIRKDNLHNEKVKNYNPDESMNVADPSNTIEEKLIRDEIACAKSKLSSSQKRLIHLLYWQGYSLAEIARLENEPLGTIKSRLHQSLKQLKKHIEMEG